MKATVCFVVAVALSSFWFSTASAGSSRTTQSGAAAAPILSSVHYYAYEGDPQAVMITVTVYDNYLGDKSKYQWVYQVVNNSYDPYTYPFASNGFSGFLLYLGLMDPNEVADIESPGPGWVIGAQYSLPINWDIIDADGIMPGQSGTFSFTTYPRYTATMEGYFNTRWFGIPVEPVYFTTSDGPEGPGGLRPPNPTGACCFDNGSCSVMESSTCAAAGGVYMGDNTACDGCSPPGPCYANGFCQMMQEANCNSAGGQFCPNPKALLVAWPKTNSEIVHMAIELIEAEKKLKSNGWSTERLPLNTDWAVVANSINNDPCVRTLFMDAHGTPSHDIVVKFNGVRQARTPQQIASDIPNHHLDYLTVFLCLPSGWHEAFPNTAVRHNSQLIRGLTNWKINLRDIVWGHGVGMETCTGSPQAFSLARSSGDPQRLFTVNEGENECSSFPICDSTGCGEEIYPVYSCRDSSGVASAGIFTISSPEMFEVAAHLPADYVDTLRCAATYFEVVPDTLLHPSAIPLGRFLMFVDIETDTLVSADSFSVVMNYLDPDLTAAGITDESKLGIYWITSESPEFQFVPSVLDTAANSLSFTVPQWGLAGIYEIEGATATPGVWKPDHLNLWLDQNRPNPFNPNTTISFTLPERTNAKLSIHDVQGRLVTLLVDQVLEAGYKEYQWDGKDRYGNRVSSGVYFCRLKAGNQTLTKKMVLVR